jgi:acyl-coenzyme A thioesterase 13
VDVLGTLALLSLDRTKPGVSVELNISFLSAAKVGDKLIIEGEVMKAGRRMGFTQVTIRREEGNQVVAVGRHTKAFP